MKTVIHAFCHISCFVLVTKSYNWTWDFWFDKMMWAKNSGPSPIITRQCSKLRLTVFCWSCFLHLQCDNLQQQYKFHGLNKVELPVPVDLFNLKKSWFFFFFFLVLRRIYDAWNTMHSFVESSDVQVTGVLVVTEFCVGDLQPVRFSYTVIMKYLYLVANTLELSAQSLGSKILLATSSLWNCNSDILYIYYIYIYIV